MTTTEKELLASIEKDLNEKPLDFDSKSKIKTVVDFEQEIDTLREMISKKEEELREKIKALSPDEKYVYELQKLKGNIVKNANLRSIG